MEKVFIAVVFMTILLSCTPKQQTDTDSATAEQDERMEWWREARFGLFVHWGLHSQAAGEWKGEKIPWIGEWIMARAKIPVKEYEKLAENFNPVKYDAEQWVKLVKQTGMKYIVICAKHHEGFAMFHSKVSKYNIVDATPFDRDPLKELADACKKHGIRLGFYYSHAMDWYEPGGMYRNIATEGGGLIPGTLISNTPHWDPDLEREPFMNYIEGKALPQVKEILENYGGLDILWWDTPLGMTEETAQMFKNLTDQYPKLITNNRLYEPWPGDFSTPEGHVPPTGLDYDWEVCMPMNNTWGYKHYDDNWKSSEILIRMLADIASKGGNLLLNVGPTDEGLIPEPSVERLKAIGEWMAINNESIYGTDASPFFKLPWGRCTQRKTKNGTTLYLHVFNWPKDQVLRVPGLKTQVKYVSLLSDKKKKLLSRFEEGDLLIDVPATVPDPVNTVIVVETKGELVVTRKLPSLKEGKILLPASLADIDNPSSNAHAVLRGSGENSFITNWIDPRASLGWTFNTTESGIYNIEALVKADEPVKVSLRLRGKAIVAEIPAGNGEFQMIDLGEIEISVTGVLHLALRPVAEYQRPFITNEQPRWKGIELARVELIKQ